MLQMKRFLETLASNIRSRDSSVDRAFDACKTHFASGGKSAETAVCPKVPVFDEAQKRRIRLTWLAVHSELGQVGILHISNLLEQKSEFKSCFEKLRDMDADQLRNSPIVRMHAMSILNVLEKLISRLDNTAVWNAIIADLARSHVGLSVKPRLARDVAFSCWKSIECVLKNLGYYNQETEELWLAIIWWLAAAMEIGLGAISQQ